MSGPDDLVEQARREVEAIRQRIRDIEARIDANRTPDEAMNRLIRRNRRGPLTANPDATDERRAAIIEAAKAARFRNPDLAARILAGEKGDPEALVAELGAAEPYLIGPSMNEIIRRGAGRSEA